MFKVLKFQISFYIPQVSLNSNQSLDSRMSFTQVYIKTGTYKGQIVALKVYESKMLHINRDIKKQMKMVIFMHHYFSTYHAHIG